MDWRSWLGVEYCKNATYGFQQRHARCWDSIWREYTYVVRRGFLPGDDARLFLSWNSHIDHLASKLAGFCYSLRVVARCVSAEAALSAYNAYINSRLRYGVMFWGNCVSVHRIFKLQKSSIRAIFNLKNRDSCKQYFKNNDLLTLPSLYVLECALFVKRNYQIFFEKYELVHNHNTRGTMNCFLLQPKTHLTKIQKNVLHQCIKVYNHIPDAIKILPYNSYKKNWSNY